ncbi:MAG: hypothetical protein EBY21_14855 [Alphaproteobacteria bacterium]|nr:hypothetical protein [Alphaproteobacteria bacterium]
MLADPHQSQSAFRLSRHDAQLSARVHLAINSIRVNGLRAVLAHDLLDVFNSGLARREGSSASRSRFRSSVSRPKLREDIVKRGRIH